MGVSQSKVATRGEDNMPSPSMAYGRLRIHESPRLSSHNAVGKTKRTTNSGIRTGLMMQRSLSANTLVEKGYQQQQVLESTSLLILSTTDQQQQDLGLTHDMDGDGSNTPSHDKSPLLGTWLTPALLCGFSYAFYNIFIKLGSYSIHPVLGGVILQIIAALLGTVLILRTLYVGDGDKSSSATTTLEYDSNGILWSVCAGIAVGLAEMLSFFVSSMGVQAVQSIPVIIGGSVMFGTLLGWILLKENLSYRGWFGVLLLVGGICLVGTDPAAAQAS